MLSLFTSFAAMKTQTISMWNLFHPDFNPENQGLIQIPTYMYPLFFNDPRLNNMLLIFFCFWLFSRISSQWLWGAKGSLHNNNKNHKR
jgi:hypothetical protein